MARSKIASELERIAKAHRGMLRPEYVVEAARNKQSPLHDSFEWDNGRAAEKFRLIQAERLLRVHVVETTDNKSRKAVRVFVSLSGDRHPGGGYRRMMDVLSDHQLRQQLLEDAKTEMNIFVEKYARVTELTEVLSVMRETISALKHETDSA